MGGDNFQLSPDERAEHRGRLLELLREKSLKLAPPGKPFTLASGKTSNHYIDGKKTTCDPEGLYRLSRLLLDICAESGAEIIGGPTMGADPIAGGVSALSFALGHPVPMFLVRKEAKRHGTQSRIEGVDVNGRRAIIVEDVITTGGSVLTAIESVREAGSEVLRVVSVVDREQGGRVAFREAGLAYEPLFSIQEILPPDYAREKN